MTRCTSTYQPQQYRKPGDPIPAPLRCVRPVLPDGRHRGDHQGWEQKPAGEREVRSIVDGAWVTSTETWGPWSGLWTWSDRAGARGDARLRECQGCNGHPHTAQTHTREDHAYITCPSCGCWHDPHGHSREWSSRCFTCRLWEDRAEKYARGDAVRDTRRGMAGRWSRPVRPHDDALAGHPRLYGWSHGHGGAFGGAQFTVTWDDGQTAGPADFLWDSGAIPWWMLDRFPPNATVTRGDQVPRAGHTDPFGKPLRYTGHP